MALRQRETDETDEGPMLKTLDCTIRIGITPTFLYFETYVYICVNVYLTITITIIIIYSGYPLHRSVFQWGPAKIMYNTVTIQYNTMQLVSFNAVFYS